MLADPPASISGSFMQKPLTQASPEGHSCADTQSFMHTGSLGAEVSSQTESRIAGVTHAAPDPKSAHADSLAQLFVQTPHAQLKPAAQAVLVSQSVSHDVFPSLLDPPDSHAMNPTRTEAHSPSLNSIFICLLLRVVRTVLRAPPLLLRARQCLPEIKRHARRNLAVERMLAVVRRNLVPERVQLFANAFNGFEHSFGVRMAGMDTEVKRGPPDEIGFFRSYRPKPDLSGDRARDRLIMIEDGSFPTLLITGGDHVGR